MNEICRPSSSATFVICPIGSPFSPSSCVGWMCSVELSGLPASVPSASPSTARSAGVRSSCAEKTARPWVETVEEER